MKNSSPNEDVVRQDNNNMDLFTGKEIEGQPELWLDILELIKDEKDSLLNFLNPLYKNSNPNILLTGAGSSAFIGKSIQHAFKKRFKTNVTAVSTTSLVTHFENYVAVDEPLFMIHFARSGNSPESIASLELAETLCSDIHHLAITCNSEGELAKQTDSLENGYVFTLPPQAEDRGLAMTGSFTGMMLSAILITLLDRVNDLETDLKAIAGSAKTFFKNYKETLYEIAAYEFNRIVFLGSGPLFNIARESHLKVQELTDGLVIGKHDSFLGFRHGPRAVVDDKTVVIYLFSRNPHVFRYETDLAEQIEDSGEHLLTIGVFPSESQIGKAPCDRHLLIDTVTDDELYDLTLPLFVIPAQLLGYYKSLEMGLNPDSPSTSDTISRVVKGVTIYPLP